VQWIARRRRERQLEGISKAKAAGVYKGRRPSIDLAQVEKAQGGWARRYRDCKTAQDRPRNPVEVSAALSMVLAMEGVECRPR
jgi:DNA invertase Pin-like site-specific DNA recombinase